jgi:cell division protein FtsB
MPTHLVLELDYTFLEMRFNEALAHNMELLQTLHESLEEQDNLRNGQRLSNDASELQQQLDIKRAECDKLRQTNTQLKNDTVKHEQDTNQQLDQLMRQEASLQRVIHNLEDETESLKEEMRASQGTVKKHTELLVEQHNTLFFRMLHDVFSVIHWKRSTWTLRTPGGMPEVCRKEYDRPNSDLLDEHDKWFCNLSSDQKPENYPEWYNSWMDTKHGLYVLYVAGMLMQPNLISPRLMLNPLPASLEDL